LAQKIVRQQISPIELLLAIRERNRQMTFAEYIEKIGLGKKFQQLARKENLRTS